MTGVRAAVLEGPRTIALRTFELPDVAEGAALLRVEACGVCGADWLPYIGARPVDPPGMILGHEIVGVVSEISPGASAAWGVAAGDRVVVEEPIPCGSCRNCLAGRYQMCPEPRYGGKSAAIPPSLWGGYSEVVYLHPRSKVHRVPRHLEATVVPLFVPVSNGLYWVRDVGGCRPGQAVVVLGPGQHGLGCVVAAKEIGATAVVVGVAGRDEDRLQLALDLGADVVLSLGRDDVVARVLEFTDGQLADVVVQVADRAPQAFALSVELAGDGGVVVEVGNTMGKAQDVDPDLIMRRGLTIKGVQGRYGPAIPEAIEILGSTRHPLGLLGTHVFPLDRTDEALRTMGRELGDGAIHVTVVP